MNKELVIRGKVFSGNKKGGQFVNLLWVKKQIHEKIGFIPHTGTLNLRITNKTGIDQLRRTHGIKIVPEKGYCEGKVFKALVMGKVEAAVVLPDVPEYPPDILEILAPVNLRKSFGLTDGIEVEVAIKIE